MNLCLVTSGHSGKPVEAPGRVRTAHLPGGVTWNPSRAKGGTTPEKLLLFRCSLEATSRASPRTGFCTAPRSSVASSTCQKMSSLAGCFKASFKASFLFWARFELCLNYKIFTREQCSSEMAHLLGRPSADVRKQTTAQCVSRLPWRLTQ